MAYRESPSSPLIVSGGKTVEAIDLESGARLWGNGDFGDAAGGALLITPDRIYVAGWRQAGAIDASTGRTLWRVEIETSRRPGLIKEGDRLLVAGTGVVECLSIDGRVLWRKEIPSGNSVSIGIGDRIAVDDRE